jgi:ribosomal protein S18 acetylase RimI-like enzyme
MKVHHRAFDETQGDFEQMWRFLVDDYAVRQDWFIWTIGRLGDWKYGLWNETKRSPNFMRDNAHLWFTETGDLPGFVISENGDCSFSVFAGAGFECLYDEMLAWVKANRFGREGGLSTEVREDHDGYIRALLRQGFRKKEVAAVTRQYDVSKKAAEGYSLAEGFRIEDMLTRPDLAGKARLYHNAWRHDDVVTQDDLLRYRYNRENPCFDPRFDLSVVDKNGVYVSACMAFIDRQNKYAEIEKVCTYSEYRQRGLAEAVIRECFRRLHAEGIQHAYITGYDAAAKNLYSKLGAVNSRVWYEYAFDG